MWGVGWARVKLCIPSDLSVVRAFLPVGGVVAVSGLYLLPHRRSRLKVDFRQKIDKVIPNHTAASHECAFGADCGVCVVSGVPGLGVHS